MKVLCIEKGFWGCITIGKWYRVIYQSDNNYNIIDDDGDEFFYSKRCFKTQQEVREEKLKQIGI